MAARRKRRGRRRRGRFGFLYKFLSTLLILAAMVMGCIVFFRVNTVVVAGDTRYSESEILDAAGVEMGENLFGLNKFEIVGRMRDKLPYVDTIAITRKPPDTLVITVTPCTPIAALESGGKWWLLDVNCKILEQGDASLAQGRAVLTGLTPLAPAVGTRLEVEEAQRLKFQGLSDLLSALVQRGMADRVTEFIDLTAENEVRFGYNGLLTVEMPLFDDFQSQTWRLQRALEELESKNGTVTGTLHLPSEGNEAWLLAERWLPGTAETAPPEVPETEAPPAPSPSAPPEG